MDHLIVKYLNRDISLEEMHQLSKWLDQDPRNAKVLKDMELYWQFGEFDFSDEKEEVLGRITREIAKEGQQPVVAQKQVVPLWVRSALKYAAIVIFVVAAAALFFDKSERPAEPTEIVYIEKECPLGQKMTTYLSDGTMVKLNAGSKLRFPEQFSDGVRNVMLEGEAFFDVERDENRPFIITTDKMQVEVLGTSFNVQAYKEQRKQIVAVKSGKVSVSKKQLDQNVILIEHQQANLHNGSLEKLEIIDPEYAFGWTDQKMVFKASSLEEVLTTIERWYNVDIAIEDKMELSKETCNAIFDNPTIDQVMGSISFIYKFDYEIEKNTINIKSK